MGQPLIRDAIDADVAAVCRFGETHIPPHYAPLIGKAAADAQVAAWWNASQINAAIADGLVAVAVDDGAVIGVGQRGRYDGDHVIYKLYLDPAYRGQGLGVQLIDVLIAQLPDDADRVFIEHVAANERAGLFYEREGFVVERIEPHASGDARLATVWRVRLRAQ